MSDNCQKCWKRPGYVDITDAGLGPCACCCWGCDDEQPQPDLVAPEDQASFRLNHAPQPTAPTSVDLTAMIREFIALGNGAELKIKGTLSCAERDEIVLALRVLRVLRENVVTRLGINANGDPLFQLNGDMDDDRESLDDAERVLGIGDSR